MTKVNCLVVGADGFIGSFLTKQLVAMGMDVSALLLRHAPGPWRAAICQDLLGPGQIDFSELGPLHTIFHLAGKAHAVSEIGKDDEYFAINVVGTRKILEAARRTHVQRFVFFSSVKAMGEGSWGPEDESTPCRPVGAYGKSKLEAEELVLHGNYVPQPVVIRPTMVYGPSKKGNLPRLITMIRRGLFPPLSGVRNRRSMVHVEDIVRAAILAAERPEAVGQTYIVTDGRGYSTRDLYEIILRGLGRHPPRIDVPIRLLRPFALLGDFFGRLAGRRPFFDSTALERICGSAFYSSEKIEEQFQFKPLRNLENSIDEMIEFLT